MMMSVGCGGAKISEIACYVEAIVPIKKGGLTLIKSTSSNLPISSCYYLSSRER